MKKFILAIIILSILTTGLFSCTESKEKALLQKVEKMMDGNPDADSAMMLLQSINPNTLSSEGDKAYYALLMTQAEEKTTNFIANDSLISIAVKFYSRGKNTYYNMLSQYYLGRVRLYAEDYPQCIVAMFKALECATELDNKFWMGMICQSLSDTYNETYSFAEQLLYSEKEYRYMQECGRQPYLNYALLDWASALANKGEYVKSMPILKQCVDSALKYKDDYLWLESKRSMGLCLFSQEQYSEALSTYQAINSSHFSNVEDSAYLCLAYIYCENLSQAHFLLNSLSKCEEPFYGLLKSEIYTKQDSLKDAFEAFKISEDVATKKLRERIGMNITSSTIDYFRLSKEAANAESKAAHTLLWLVLVVSFLIFIIVAILVYSYRKKQLAKIEQNVIIAEQLRESLINKELQYAGARDSVKDLLSSKYEIFDELCRLVYQSNNTTIARKRISDSVTFLIKQMQNDSDMLKGIEKLVDYYCFNLIADLRKDLPNMPDSYYKLFLFSVLDFSDITISLLLKKEKTSQIYNMRRHLKDKIKDLEVHKKDKYIRFL